MPLIGSYIQELCLFKVGAEVLLCSPGYSQTTEVKWSSCLIFPICCYKYVPGSVNVSEGLLWLPGRWESKRKKKGKIKTQSLPQRSSSPSILAGFLLSACHNLEPAKKRALAGEFSISGWPVVVSVGTDLVISWGRNISYECGRHSFMIWAWTV